MYIKTIKPYKDKHTLVLYGVDMVREVTKKRANELIAGGYAVESKDDGDQRKDGAPAQT